MRAFEHHLAMLIVERDGETDDAAVVALRLDRLDCELRRHNIAGEGGALVSRVIAEHCDHGLGQFFADRRGAECAEAKKQKAVRDRGIPASGPRIIGIVMERMGVAGHCREGSKMLIAQRVRPRFENFAGREIVEVTLPHDHSRSSRLRLSLAQARFAQWINIRLADNRSAASARHARRRCAGFAAA